MPRTSDVTIELARQAIQKIVSDGHEPTVRKIREMTGRGSQNTIAMVLRNWRESRAATLNQAPELQESAAHQLTRAVELERENAALKERAVWLSEQNAELQSRCTHLEARLEEMRLAYERQLDLAHERYRAVEVRTMLQLDAERMARKELADRLRKLEGADDDELKIATLTQQLAVARADAAQATAQIMDLEREIAAMRGDTLPVIRGDSDPDSEVYET